MIFFIVLALATAGAFIAVRNLRTAARWGFGIAMVVAGAAHLGNPVPFEQHLPEWVPAPGALVALTGVIEIALGVALMAARTRRRAVGLATAAYLAAVFPANVYVAVAGVDVEGQPGGIYPWVRLPLQALFIAWALWSTREANSGSSRRPSLPDPERATAREPSLV
jgi:uncharacterized membrane protein